MNEYQKSGVDYSVLDAAKRRAQTLARETAKNLDGTGFTDVESSRGESAYLIEHRDHYIAVTLEGLGTKDLAADAIDIALGQTFYEAIGVDTVAAIANDLITQGAQPLAIMQYLATGDTSWLLNTMRHEAFMRGFKKACDQIGASWGGGETPTLPGIIMERSADLGGCGIGFISPKSRLLSTEKIQDGDAILGIESSGIHANGLSIARTLAKALPQGYLTPIGNGLTYGEALLTPTHLYSQLMQELFAEEIALHYSVNVTGHGWTKLMRADRHFSYEVENLPPVPPVMSFITKELELSPKEAYATFNMGLGFVFYLPRTGLPKAISIANECGLKAYELGHVSSSRQSEVNIHPLGIKYVEKDLEVRA